MLRTCVVYRESWEQVLGCNFGRRVDGCRAPNWGYKNKKKASRKREGGQRKEGRRKKKGTRMEKKSGTSGGGLGEEKIGKGEWRLRDRGCKVRNQKNRGGRIGKGKENWAKEGKSKRGG